MDKLFFSVIVTDKLIGALYFKSSLPYYLILVLCANSSIHTIIFCITIPIPISTIQENNRTTVRTTKSLKYNEQNVEN